MYSPYDSQWLIVLQKVVHNVRWRCVCNVRWKYICTYTHSPYDSQWLIVLQKMVVAIALDGDQDNPPEFLSRMVLAVMDILPEGHVHSSWCVLCV